MKTTQFWFCSVLWVALLPASPGGADDHEHAHPAAAPMPPGEAGKDYRPVVTPNGTTLPWRLVDGVKVGHLVAEEVRHEFAPGLVGRLWGYNGQAHGPTIEAVEGDRVRIYVTNHLPESTSIHWHGIHVPNGMDGVGGLTQRAIEPGETFKYEFTLAQHGTFLYHPHQDEMTQMALGLMGLFVIHPRGGARPPPDRDFAILLSEWAMRPGALRPDPNEMTDFNVATFNAKVFPATAPLVAKVGDRVRIRIGNLGATDHHPIHLHGISFRVVETDGGEIPEAGQWPESTVLVPVGSTRTIEFVATAPGDWALHCHMTHHTMNQMGHDVPNLAGVDPAPFDAAVSGPAPEPHSGHAMGHEGHAMAKGPPNSIAMLGGEGPFGAIMNGGMFTVLKVRENLTSYDDPGWYAHPPGTVAVPATEDELKRDLPPDSGSTQPAPEAPAPPAPGGGDHHHHEHGK